jgi:hypothetical protein
MKQKILLLLFLYGIGFKNADAQSWNITGNSNADNNSKLGTTNNIPLRLFTNNGERMRINGAGRFGLGTTALNNAKLNVDGTVGNTMAIFGNSLHGISLVNDVPSIGFNNYYNGGWKTLNKGYSGLVAVNNFTGDIQFSTGPFANKDASIDPVVRMDITQDGNVGIGTTTPGFPLNFPNKVGDKISLYGNTGAHYGFGILGNLLQIHSDGPLSDIAFGFGSSASFTEKMRIKGNGNVGIGTWAPEFLLDVGGRMRVKSSGETAGIWYANGANTANAGFSGMYNDNNIGFYSPDPGAGWGLVMNTSNGNVGLGTVTPQYRLDVCGTIRSKEILVQTGWCDYVFDKDYKLLSLREVENFIKANKHLPDVTSGDKIETEGLEVGKVSSQMIRKIEELTLYVIAQEKAINDLKAENKKLELQMNSIIEKERR